MDTKRELDKHHGHGGTYRYDPKTGERTQVVKPTEPSSEGARDKDGKALEHVHKQNHSALPAPSPRPWEAGAQEAAKDSASAAPAGAPVAAKSNEKKGA